MLMKTTILPTDSKPQAEKMFRELIHKEAVVLFVAFGTSAEDEVMVARADNLAGLEGDPRWVVWVRKRALVENVIGELEVPKKLLSKVPGARAMCLNFDDKVCDVIGANELPKNSRILLAFAHAEEA